MTHARGRSRFPSHAGARRKTSWSGAPFGLFSLAANGAAIAPTNTQALVPGLTLVRTRGELLVILESVGAINDGFRVAAGLCIVSENAFGVGVTAIPTPLTDIAWDGWLWYWAGSVFSDRTAAEAELAADNMTSVRIPIDSKAMRKFKETDVLVGVVEVVETGTATLTAHMEGRILVKLA